MSIEFNLLCIMPLANIFLKTLVKAFGELTPCIKLATNSFVRCQDYAVFLLPT